MPENQDDGCCLEVKGNKPDKRGRYAMKSWMQGDDDCEYEDLDHCPLWPSSACWTYHGHVAAPAEAGDSLCWNLYH